MKKILCMDDLFLWSMKFGRLTVKFNDRLNKFQTYMKFNGSDIYFKLSSS